VATRDDARRDLGQPGKNHYRHLKPGQLLVSEWKWTHPSIDPGDIVVFCYYSDGGTVRHRPHNLGTVETANGQSREIHLYGVRPIHPLELLAMEAE